MIAAVFVLLAIVCAAVALGALRSLCTGTFPYRITIEITARRTRLDCYMATALAAFFLAVAIRW